MTTFIDSLWNEYPLPTTISVWGTDGITPARASLDVLIDSCVQEVASDIHIIETIPSQGQKTIMPDDCITIRSCKMNLPYQGNKLIKHDYDKWSRTCFVRYIPCNITYARYLRTTDLDSLMGDRRVYVRDYILWKMATKELQMLKGVDFKTDNGEIDLSVLDKFAQDKHDSVKDLKEGILLYASHF